MEKSRRRPGDVLVHHSRGRMFVLRIGRAAEAHKGRAPSVESSAQAPAEWNLLQVSEFIKAFEQKFGVAETKPTATRDRKLPELEIDPTRPAPVAEPLASKLEELLSAAVDQSAELSIPSLAMPLAELHRGFMDGLSAQSIEGIEAVSPEDAYMWGRRAADYAVAPLFWAEQVGERLDTTQVRTLLGVSRQALSKLVRSGSLLGVPGERTTIYPRWQFDYDSRSVRPVTRLIVHAFREALGRADSLTIASWASSPQHEELKGDTPANWIEQGRDTDSVLKSARRAAARLAA